jgi:NhaA family Na+:H+ antiporter
MLQTGERKVGRFDWFLQGEVSGSIVLLACTVLALLWANSPWSASYFDLLHTQVGLSWGDAVFQLSVHGWINDGLMVIFFFVVGLEIKRELLIGHLSTPKKAILPVAAAFGGMVVPALIYAAFNAGKEGASGWGIPMATDIAFSLGVLAVLGRRVPISLKVFLTAAAIADDLGAVLVIALFYTANVRLIALVVAAVLLAALYFFTRVLRVRRLLFLLILIVAIWVCVFVSGIHATVAGILVALLVPVKPIAEPPAALRRIGELVGWLNEEKITRNSVVLNHEQLESLAEIEEHARDLQPSGLRFEHYWHPVQAFVILPLFALANAGVPLGEGVVSAITSPVGLGIALGLFLGKQTGFMLATWLAVRSGKAELPEGFRWLQFWGVSCLAGIGFTMSLFVSELAFSSEGLLATAKIAILAGSIVSACVGYAILNAVLPKEAPSEGAL